MSALKYITFDCYGTLTRFRITEMVREMLADRLPPDRIETFIADYTNYRLDQVLGPWQPYSDVIKTALERTCRKHAIPYIDAQGQQIYDAVPTWGPHPDVAAPLTRIGQRIPLVILSNADDAQIGHNVEKLEAPFHAVFTAEQAQSYKPRMRGFEYMFDHLGARPEECMHVSSSMRYDHMTAHDLGYHRRVFVDRNHGPIVADYITDRVTGIDGLATLLGSDPTMQMRPYWQATAPPFTAAAEGPIEGTADVAIVGGGFTGLSAALALCQRGASVVLFEAEKIAAAASGRNGGHVNNGTAHDFAGLADRLGLDHARALYHAYDHAVDTVERLVREHQITCDFRRGGKIKLAAKPAHYETIAKNFETLRREADPDTELVPKSRLRDEIGSDAFHGGLVFRKSAQMHMGKFAAGLADAAARQGARIYENALVTDLQRTQTGHRVTTSRGTVMAKQVLLATGPSQRGPFPWFRRRVIPIGSYIIATAPLDPAQLDSIMPTRRTATTTKHVGNYFRIAPDNRLIWGGRARFALSSPTSDAKSGRILEHSLHQTFPQLGNPRIDYCWGGVIDLTANRLPRAGEHDGLFYAIGFSGHGAQMSVHMGQQMARILAGDAAANPFAGLDWPAIPGHFGPPWFMPFVGAYYRLKDRFG